MMELILVTGGVRSGKSRRAQDEARARGGDEVTVIATAEAVDDEMRERIEAHRRTRPAAWQTIEAAEGAGGAILAAPSETVVLDCVTVLTGMAIGRSGAGSEAAALDAMAVEVDGILAARDARAGVLIVVTNEVGWSVHPPTAVGRWYQDGLGIANQRLAAAADRVILMVSGLEVRLK
ncbi:MAG: bifunctional adenosylcobinamide kinase/adenosylcobinamide-phosphate guanylyltransferase [Gammaproteobacteria bacterium]|nr:bifunctional adenosylcobinamide kinase/adenosylcobinamide-phosphate guanylyltransferase [Gammaproteobacteria bacterium]MDE2883010.1 bifunctional adenosylcobinamide kinase/adenosylcobinamide-phosphate guanylyltransferase [Acidobacteriota bacterium]